MPACASGLGSLVTGEAFDPSPRDEFSIGFKRVDDVSDAETVAETLRERVADAVTEAKLVACTRLGALTPPHAHEPSSVTTWAPLGAALTVSPWLTGTWSLYCALLPPTTAQPQHPNVPAQLPQPAQQLSAPLATVAN